MIDDTVFSAILEDVRAGMGTQRAVLKHGVAVGTFYGGLDADSDRRERYAQARVSSMDAIADEAMQIADDPNIESDHKRVMVDSRKWFLSKLAPKKYGDKLELAGDSASPLTLVISKSDAKL